MQEDEARTDQLPCLVRVLVFIERMQLTPLDSRVLVPKDDTETLDFPSSCESYERTVYYRDEDGRRYEKTCHSIASVVGVCLCT